MDIISNSKMNLIGLCSKALHVSFVEGLGRQCFISK